MNIRLKQPAAAALGASIYLFLTICRAAIYESLDIWNIGHWYSAIDATTVYAIALGAGFLAAYFNGDRPLRSGLLAAAIGEFAHALIKIILATSESNWMSLPPLLGLDLLLGIIPAAILGFAGAAIALATGRRV